MIKNLIIIISILGFVAVVVLLDVPGVQNALALRRQINIQKQAFLDKEELIKTVEKLNVLYGENKESVDKSSIVLPSDEDIPNLIVQFEALAFEQGLLLTKIGLSETKKEGEAAEDFKTMSIALNLTGSYPAFKNFMMAAEENMRLLDIQSISFSYQQSEDEEGEEQISDTFDFSVTLNTYYK